MSCPICDHTMHVIGYMPNSSGNSASVVTTGPSVYWCPRCGTLKSEGGNDVPKLVPRVRQLLDDTNNDELAWILGVTEAIWRPDQRRAANDGE